MATTYYSSIPPASATSASTTVNIPDNYFLNAPGGKVDVKSSADTKIAAGAKIIGIAGADIDLLSTGGKVKIESAGTEVDITAGTDVMIKAEGLVIIDAPETDILGDIVLGDALDSDIVEFKSRIKSKLLPKGTAQYDIGSASTTWKKSFFEQGEYFSGNNVGNPYLAFGPTGRPYDPANIYDTAAHRQSGAVYVAGGVGIEKDLNVGGFIYGRIEIANTSLQLAVTATNVDLEFHPTFALTVGQQFVYIDDTGIDNGLSYNPYLGRLKTDQAVVLSTNTATADTGALRVEGGISVGQNIVAKNVNPTLDADTTSSIYSVGTPDKQWAESYVHNLYTRIIASTTGTIEIKPKAGVTDVYGDIRVRGTNPIGTAPVVTNVLYVTMDGNDTNDGRALDSSRACRTIGGAINSAYYQPGTQILVSAGHYLEDNPLAMKPYTSVVGSDIRTTSIEPINKTQDLFHLNSGCYLNYMQFLNGRSGLLEGAYAAEFNRGAYATSFPPLEGDARIDLFHSPYVQNCTNQSGPWLRDGTMFVPNQTVQIPAAVGTGTWAANTTTIVVKANTGTISLGMVLTAGQQNPGFFNARTLMLANKPFLQEQVVAYVDATYPSFVYSKEYCYRDVGILVENISYDAAFGGNQKAVDSGLAYYNGVVSRITGQEVQTIAAINRLNQMVQSVITNSTWTDILSVPAVIAVNGTHAQVRNTVLIGGSISTSSVASLFGIVNGIILNGPQSAPAVYKSAGPDAAFVSAETLMQANRRFIQEDTINYVNSIVKSFPYAKISCKRDVGLIVDAISQDLLYPTAERSQSTFAGLQYYTQGNLTGVLGPQIVPTIDAVTYLKELSIKIIQNITTVDDLITRYQFAVPQNTTLEPAGAAEAAVLSADFGIILKILNGDSTGWSDRIVPNGDNTNLTGFINAFNLLIANKAYLAAEVVAYVNSKYPALTYNSATCARDVGLIINSVAFDLTHGGNRQAVQAGLYYYAADATSSTIHGQETQTVAAFNRIRSIVSDLLLNNLVTVSTGTKTTQNTSLPVATSVEVTYVQNSISTITNIIQIGTSAAPAKTAIALTASSVLSAFNGYQILKANRAFIVDDVISYIDWTYNPGAFNYDEQKCYRDTGLIVDAVSQDILLGGNYKSIEAGSAYWSAGYNYVAGQETTTTMAINYAKNLALQIIANQAVVPQTQTNTTQIINPFFQYGGDYMPQEAVKRNFNIITTIVNAGPAYAPPRYMGGGLFALVGINGADVKTPPKVTSVTTLTTGTYRVGLDMPTVGFGNNSTIYFGDTATYPKRDFEVDDLTAEYNQPPGRWDQRKTDPIGSMGGSLVDGAVISTRSPINSFVYDAFTQVNQGGRGIRITNDGYAQLVSVFTIFCSVGVQVDRGGIASIVNSNANFGDLCLVAKGYGERKFSGTVYNPVNKSYPDDPEFNQYYPTGYWPNNARARIFLPDLTDRPHISLVMEIVPPDTQVDFNGATIAQVNEQGFPGFLNAAPNLGVLSTGTITLTGIDTTDIAVGNKLYIRDQFGSQTGSNATAYAAVDTIVTDVGYQSVTLNKALTNGGFDPTNTPSVVNNNYFTLYFCGNAYYTVLGSEVGDNPVVVGTNIIRGDQRSAHISSLQHLQQIVIQVIDNQTVTQTAGNVATQTLFPMVTGGAAAGTFIEQRFTNLINIINPALASAEDTLAGAESIVLPKLRTKTGPPVSGAGAAITLITANIDFLTAEISAYIAVAFPEVVYSDSKCRRDVKLILQRMIYDIETGGRYNTVMSGLSYWQRDGTHHLVQLGENVTRTDLFPDGATVNFYQRSYISASGYVFEYVGAGTNYGALPQVGFADPVQTKETVQLDSGKVFFTSTDQNGDFRIGPGLVISQATGVLSGRTFTKSLFANMTPFILAIEAAG